MEDVNVVIKVVDAANNLDFEIPISSGKNSPLSITKKLSDFTDLTKRSGVQSRNFKIPISKEIASTYDFFNSAMHHNYKDIDEDKDAAIIINGNEIERGKIRVQRFSNKDGNEQVELLFYGNNFDWTEKIKNKTLADLTWVNDVINYTPATIKGSWYNYAGAGSEWVFPLENRGGRKVKNEVHTEDFRPAIFVRNLLERALQSIGYTFSSSFIEGGYFQKTVLTHFGKRFRNSQETIDNNKVMIGNYGTMLLSENTSTKETGPQKVYHKAQLNKGLNNSFIWDDTIAPHTDAGNNFDPTQGTPFYTDALGLFRGGRFTAPQTGYYKFFIKMKGNRFNYNFNSTGDVGRLKHVYFVSLYKTSGRLKHSISGYDMPNQFAGSVTGTKNPGSSTFEDWTGEVTVYMETNESAEIWQFLHSKDGDNIALLGDWRVQINNVWVDIDLLPKIAELDTFNLSDVVDDQVLVLDIINDLTKMFNLYWDTDPVLKKIYIEPRDTFYGEITDAIDWTDRIDVSKEIKTRFNSSDHKRDFVFSYQQDSADKFVAERNKNTGNLLGDYSHSLSNKFKDGKTTIKCKVLAPTYYRKDISSYYLPEEAPYTAMYFDEYTNGTPEKVLEDHKPRILNYQIGRQKEMRDGVLQDNKFWFFGESEPRPNIPSVLPHQVKIGATVVVYTSFNLYWHTHHEQNGLFTQYWSKTITEIASGTNSAVSVLFDQKMWAEFSFNNIVYFDEPADIKGYWVVEKLSNYQPENSKLVRVKLLKRIEYDAQVEGNPSIWESIPQAGIWNNRPPSNAVAVQYTFVAAGEETIQAPMQSTGTDGTTSIMYMTFTAA